MIISSDILVKTMIEAAIVDLRKNPWLLDDVFGGLATDSLASDDYGYKEVDQAKKWFLNNNIFLFMQFRVDDPIFPCITVVHNSSTEMLDRASLGDARIGTEMDISSIRTTPTKVYNNFNPKNYNPATGTVELPKGRDTGQMAPGMFLICQKTGHAYEILAVTSDTQFAIAAGTVDNFTELYIVPPSSLWNVEHELTYVREVFQIGAHAQSDPVQNIWLHQLLWYIFLRYKEVYLEARGFEISTLSSGPMEKNQKFESDLVFSRYITLIGQVRYDWIKYVAPKLQVVTGELVIIDGPLTPPGYREDVDKQGWRMEADMGMSDVLGGEGNMDETLGEATDAEEDNEDE